MEKFSVKKVDPEEQEELSLYRKEGNMGDRSHNFHMPRGPKEYGGFELSEETKKVVESSANLDYSTIFESDSDYDDENSQDILAKRLIEQIATGSMEYEYLDRIQKNLIFSYFYKRNPIVGRVIDIHADIPLSKFRLQPPQGVPEIMKDFIMDFYDKIFSKVNFEKVLRDAAIGYFVHGDSKVLVDDYFEDDKELQDLESELDENIYTHSEEDLKEIEGIEDRYSKDPESVALNERIPYLKKKFLGFFSSSYQGPDNIRAIDNFDIEEWYENKDIGFESIRYKVSESLDNLMHERGVNAEVLMDLGYSKGFLNLYNKSDGRGVLIDNDHLEGLPFIVSFSRFDKTSIIERILDDCIEWHSMKAAFKVKIQNLGRIGRIITAEDISENQTEALKAEVNLMLDDPGHAIVANFPITWDEVNTTVKDELNELLDMSDKMTSAIMMGLGVPESLVSGDSQYSGDAIKLEVLNTQYLAFKQDIQTVIEECLIKPIALRKGFISIDAWGSPRLIYPKATFSKISIRNDDVYDILFTLYQKGSLPVTILYDILNIETEDIERGIKDDLFTVLDPNFNDIIQDILGNASDDIYSETDIKERLIESMNLTVKERTDEEDEDSGGGFRF